MSNGLRSGLVRCPLARVLACALAYVLLGATAPAGAWIETLAGSGGAQAVAVAPNGDVIAAGRRSADGTGERVVVTRRAGANGGEIWLADLGGGDDVSIRLVDGDDVVVGARLRGGKVTTVLRLDGATGNVQWRYRARRTAGSGPVPLALALNGDVYVAYLKQPPNGRGKTQVDRLARATGVRTWTQRIPQRAPLALVSDARGDLVVAATANEGSSAIVKLARSNGAVVWQTRVPIGPDLVLAARPDGDALIAGRIHPPDGDAIAGVIDLRSETGAERWRFLSGPGLSTRVVATPAGDVLLAVDVEVPGAADALESPGALVRGVALTRIAGTTGLAVWRRTLADATGAGCGASALAAGAHGAPVLGGCVRAAGGAPEFRITRVAPDDGRVVWQRSLAAAGDAAEAVDRPVLALALGTDDAVAAAGIALDGEGRRRFAIVKWADADGGDLLSAADRACRDAIAKEGRNLLLVTMQALEACRDRINGGVLDVAPEDCPAESATQRSIDRVRSRTRQSIAGKCPVALPAGVSCAATLDELIAPGGASGCLVESHDAVGHALVDVVYGGVLTGAPPSVRACQTATGTAGRRLVTELTTALEACRGRGTATTTACLADPGYVEDRRKAATAARSRIRGACSAADTAAVPACAGTLDGLVGPAFDDGCLLEASELGAETVLRAERD